MGEVLVDTSAWLDFFRSYDSPHAEILDELLDHEMVCTAKVIMAEIIPGAKSPKQFQELKDYFAALPQVVEPPDLWERIMDLQFRLRKVGVDGMSIPDLIIAVTAHAGEKSILTKDKDFKQIQKVLPISLYEA